MVVVFHHIGSPRHSTISQKERMTLVRLRMSAGFSGGGCFRVDASGAFVDVTASEVVADIVLSLVVPWSMGCRVDMAILAGGALCSAALGHVQRQRPTDATFID
jgi:hypothetical protein